MGPPSSPNNACFSLWFPLQQPAASSNMLKKRSCELANYSASTEKKKGTMRESGTQSVSTSADNNPSTMPRNKPQKQSEPSVGRITINPQIDLWYNILTH